MLFTLFTGTKSIPQKTGGTIDITYDYANNELSRPGISGAKSQAFTARNIDNTPINNISNRGKTTYEMALYQSVGPSTSASLETERHHYEFDDNTLHHVYQSTKANSTNTRAAPSLYEESPLLAYNV